MMKPLIASSLLLLSACGGGGGGTSPVPDGNPNGIYSGSFTQKDVTFNMAGIVYNNRFVGASIEAGALYSGDILVKENNFEGLIDVLNIGGDFDHTTNISGTFVQGDSFTGTSSSDTESASFTFTMAPVFNRLPNVNLAGIYGYTDGGYTFTVNVANDGSFEGSLYDDSDSEVCRYSGTQNAFDSTHNLYRLVLTVTNCSPNNGTYSGYAFNDDDIEPNELLAWVIDDPDFVAVVVSQRQ